MGKLALTEFITLDGVVQDPHLWSLDYWADDIAKFKDDEMLEADALLLGRITYDGFAAAWPQSTEEGADVFNNIRKYVASTTHETVEWTNSHLLEGDVPEAVARLKAESDDVIYIHGSPTLAQNLMEHDLIDEIRLLVYPLIRGEGQRLFPNGLNKKFKLKDCQRFETGAVALIYGLE